MNIRRIQIASPLSLLVLSACGGGGGGALSALINGTAINGPLFGARVFLDVADANGDFNGVYNAADGDILADNNGLTDALGDFTVDTSSLGAGASYRIVVESTDTTVINYGGEDPDASDLQPAGGFTLTAPEGSGVVTPITTLIEQGGLTPADVATALGLEGVDLLEFNPFDTTDAETALKAEKVSMQIVTTLETLSSAAETVGASGADAAAAAVGALVSVIENKVNTSGTLDLAPNSLADPDNDIAALQDSFKTELTNEGIATGAIDALEDEIARSIQVVNSAIDAIPEDTDLTAFGSDDADASAALTTVVNTFSSAKLLSDQIATAVASGDADDISFTSEDAFAASAANSAPTGVVLSSAEVNEGPLEDYSIGSLTLSDGEDSNSTPSFEVIASEADGALFEIVSGNILAVKEGEELDFESTDHEGGVYTVYVKGIDDGGKSAIQKLEIQSVNVAEAPQLSESSTSTAEDAEFTYTIQAFDPEGDTITNMEVVGDLPSWLDFNFATSTGGVLSGTPDNDDVGEVDITIRFSDDTGLSGNQTFTLTVTNVNDAPTISFAEVETDGTQGEEYSQVITASDVDHETSELTITLKSAPDWVEFDAETNTVSGTPTSGDVGSNTITLTATDSDGGTSDNSYTVNVANVNDAPEISEPTAATITEGADGADNTSENLSGTFTVSDPDTPFVAESLTLTLGDGAVNNGDGTFSIDGTYTTLTINSSERSYVITPNESAIDALLEGAEESDAYTVTVTDLSGETASTTLTVNITGANNEPTITVENDDLVTLSDGADGQFVANLVATDDVDESVPFTLAAASDSNDNDSFVIDGNVLSLKEGEAYITDFSTKSSYTIDVIATDSDGAIATKTYTVGVSSVNSAPSITSIAIASDSTSEGYIGLDDEIVIEARTSEAVNEDSSFAITLSNDAVVTMTRDAETANKFTGTYTVEAGDDTEADTVLSVASYNSGDVVEANYDPTGAPAPLISGSETIEIGSGDGLIVDATAPTASLDNSGHAYDATTGVITLAGSNLLTVGVNAGESVKGILDFTKLTWDVDGGDAITLTFTEDDIATATADDASTLTITLTSDAKSNLHALDGFGGATATGGTADVIDVAAGFLKDAAGNVSSEESPLSNAAITLETDPPVINEISISPSDVALFGIGGEIDITLQMSEELNPSSELTLLLTNDAVVSFTVNADDATQLVGQYTVAADEDVAAGNLSVQLAQSNTVLDIAGNALPDGEDMVSDSLTDGLETVAIDATAPTASISATGHSYDASTGVLTLAGSQLDTLGIAVEDTDGGVDGDASSVVDMTKLTWDVDAGETTTLQMAEDAAESIVLTDANTLTITLTADAQTSLHALAGFGGTDATGGTADAIDIATGFVTDTAGNESTGLANPVANAEVTLADTTAPTITEITSATSDGDILGAGDTITFTAAISEDLKDGSEMTITLSNGATVALTRVADDADAMTGDYIIEESDDEANGDSPLSIAAYNVGTSLDISGNALAGDTTIADFDSITAHVIDTTPPEATIAATGHTYNASTGVLALSGTNFDTLGITPFDDTADPAEDGDASSVVDATKLSWDINGSGAAPKVFAADDFASIVVTDATTLTLTLTSDAQTDLHGREDFGGTDATDGIADAIDVAIGFLSDTAGNVSTGIASPVANAEVTLADETAPSIDTITSATSDGDLLGVGDTITLSATVSENMGGTDGELVLTLSNGASVTLSHSDATTLTGDYVIASDDLDTFGDDGDDDTLELSIVSYTPDITDVSGNAVATDLTIADFDDITSHVIDTTSPQLTVATWISDELVIAFNEQIDATSITDLTAALQSLDSVAADASITNQDSGNITFKITSTEVSAGTIDITDFDVTDLAGNTTTITELDIV